MTPTIAESLVDLDGARDIAETAAIQAATDIAHGTTYFFDDGSALLIEYDGQSRVLSDADIAEWAEVEP